MNHIFLDDHRLEVGEHLLVKVLLDVRLVKRFHLMRLVQYDTVPLELGQDHPVENRVILLLMLGNYAVDLTDGVQRLLHRLVALNALEQRAVVTRNTYLVKLLQVG